MQKLDHFSKIRFTDLKMHHDDMAVLVVAFGHDQSMSNFAKSLGTGRVKQIRKLSSNL